MVKLSQQLKTTQAVHQSHPIASQSPPSLPSEMRETIRRIKVRKFIDSDKDTLIGEEKAAWTSKPKKNKTKQKIITFHRQEVVLPSKGKQGSIMHNGFVTSPQISRTYLPSSFPSFKCWAGYHIVWNYASVPSMPPPNSLCILSLFTVGMVREAEKVLALCNN